MGRRILRALACAGLCLAALLVGVAVFIQAGGLR